MVAAWVGWRLQGLCGARRKWLDAERRKRRTWRRQWNGSSRELTSAVHVCSTVNEKASKFQPKLIRGAT